MNSHFSKYYVPNFSRLVFLEVWKCMVKVNKFQNEFMNSSFLPKYEQKIVRISTYTEQKSWQLFVYSLGEKMTS